MDVYGLTGGIGSGKSTVASLLEDYGVPVVSADELSRIVVAKGSEGLNDVVELFGAGVLDDKGELDRRKMAAIVFQEPEKRRELESILHPRIRERFEQVLDALEKAGHEVAIYEVPLLFEKNLQGEMKAVLLVAAEESVRIRRVKERDDVTETEVRARIAAQMDEALKRRKADYVIENNGSMDDLRREIEFVLARFLRIGGTHLEDEVRDQVVTEVPIKTGNTIPPTAPNEPSRVPTMIPGGPGGPAPPPVPGVPRLQPRPAESVPIPVAPTAPPQPGRPRPSTPTAPAKPSLVETPPPADLEHRDTVIPPTRKDPAVPVRSGHTVVGPLPTPPTQDPAPPSTPQRKTLVPTHTPQPPAPAQPTRPNVPPVAVPVGEAPPGGAPAAPNPAARPSPPPAPGPTAQLRRGTVPKTAAPAAAPRVGERPAPPSAIAPTDPAGTDVVGKSPTQPAKRSGRVPAGQPTPVPPTPSAPPPPPPTVADSRPPAAPGTAAPPAEPAEHEPVRRTQTIRVNALTADDLAQETDSDETETPENPESG